MRLENLSYRYGRQGPWVLRDVDAMAAPGEAVVVLGRNGAGKSTLLQLAAGVLHPTRGAVRDRPGPVGFAPERFPADQPFSVHGYLAAMARLATVDSREAGAWIERLGLTPYRDVR
ncbi:MAG TPA: ATP-binding cassette domain-containing protein, partial [Asanoa sp.]